MSQIERLYKILKDGLPHRSDELLEKVYGSSHLGLARLGARCWDLKKNGYDIIGWHDPDNRTLYFYQLKSRLVKNPVVIDMAMAQVSNKNRMVMGTQAELFQSASYTDY